MNMLLPGDRRERSIHGLRLTATAIKYEHGVDLRLDGAEIIDEEAFVDWIKDGVDILHPPKGCANPWVERED